MCCIFESRAWHSLNQIQSQSKISLDDLRSSVEISAFMEDLLESFLSEKATKHDSFHISFFHLSFFFDNFFGFHKICVVITSSNECLWGKK